MNISVVIPCYNSSKTIFTCIESVFKQTYLPKEIIVIDDGSTDNTLILLEKLRERGPKEIDFYILSQRNSGPSVARNKGIQYAKNEWIAFLDSDDQWNVDKLEKQIVAINTDVKIVLCGTLFDFSTNPIVDNLFKRISFKDFLFKNYFNTPTVLVKKGVLEKFYFDENQRYSEDYKLWLNICYENECILLNQSLASNIENKKIYGASGLSSNLWKMEKGELSNFKDLYESKKIGFLMFMLVSLFSIIKFLKRVLFK